MYVSKETKYSKVPLLRHKWLFSSIEWLVVCPNWSKFNTQGSSTINPREWQNVVSKANWSNL